jgi:DNA-binding CsgD family transcriptional regulator/tetratricopeptide (TPR) repeat protein
MQPAARGLLEREAELSELGDLVAAAADGRGAAAAVVGPAGIGKTSLLAVARSMASERGFTCLVGRGGELESDFAYGVVRQLLERPLRNLAPGDRDTVLDGAAGHAAPLLGLGRGEGEPSADTPFAVVHALYWACANLTGRQPVLLVVDDAHWADAPSLRFLAYLVRRVEELPLLVLIAARPVPEGERAELVESVTTASELRALRPPPLSEVAVAEIVAGALDRDCDPALARACAHATGGNPFLCAALATALSERGLEASGADVVELAGKAVSELVLARLGRLPAHAAALASAVAILGTNAELRAAAALAELGEREAAAAADALAAQGMLSAGHPLEFVHPLVRAAVDERIPAAQRRLAHARAARLLDAAGASADAVAAHLLAAEPAADPWALERLLAAARSALRRGAPETAATCLRRALREPPGREQRAGVLHELGSAELALGDPRFAAEHLAEARTLAAAVADRARIARDLASAMSINGDYDAAVSVLDETLAELAGADPALALEIESQRFMHAAMAPRAPASPAPRPARVDAEPTGRTRGERAELAALATSALLTLDRPERVAEWGRRAVEGGIARELTGSGAIWHPIAYALTFADAFELMERMVADGLDEARQHGSALGAARAYQSRAMLRFRQGRLREAIADAVVALDTGREVGLVGRVVALGVLAEALAECGELEEAEAALAEAGRDAEIALHFLENFALFSRGRLRLFQGRRTEAIADFEELDRRGRRWHPWNPGMFAHRSGLALALLPDGDRDRALRLAREELALSRRWGAPRAVGVSLRTLGLAEAGDVGRERLAESVRVLEPSGAQLELARSLVELGAATRRAGSRSAAREPLHAGMELAHRCGARRLVERARHELVASGVRPRRAMRTGVDALTASELRVASLAAEGMSNRDIAQALFVTLRTVEVHLTHAYQKLDIASRRELPAALRA